MESMGSPTSSSAEQAAAQAPEFGPQMPLSEKLLAIAIRAQNFTGASGVAVAIKEGDEVVCRASWGTSAPDVGVRLRDQNSFTYQCLRAGTPMRCDDAATDPRVDAETCAALGISSIAAAPVRNGDEVLGVIGAFSEAANAFTETHMVVLTTLGEVVAKFLKDEPQAAQIPAEEPLALEVAPASVDIDPLQDLFAEAATVASSAKAAETPTDPAAGGGGVRVPKAPISALERESELRPEEMYAAADIPRDPGLVSPAEHIAPVAVPKAPKAPAAAKPLRPATQKYSPGASTPKPVKLEKTSAQVALPSFAVGKPGAGRPIEIKFFMAQAIALLQRRFVIPIAGGALVLIALGGWTIHNFHSRRAPAPAAVAQEQSSESPAPQAPEPAALTSSSPAVSNVVDVSTKPVTEKPSSVGRREREKPREKEPFVETDKPVRRPTAIPAVAPAPEPPPSVSIATASLPPPLLALKSTVPVGAAPTKISSFSPSLLVHRVPPAFPELAKKYHLQGKVVLQAKVDADGRVTDVKVISGPGVFQQSAVSAVKQWRYKPALLDGQAVESAAEITLNFSAPR